MDTSDEMAELRRMKNQGSLNEADAAALDRVDRMLRDLKSLRMLDRSGWDQARVAEVRTKIELGQATVESPKSCNCNCIGSLAAALSLAESEQKPLTLMPHRVRGAHDTRWVASIGGTSRGGYTPGDAANELALAIKRNV